MRCSWSTRSSRVRGGHAAQRLGDHVGRVVDQLLHGVLPRAFAVLGSSGRVCTPGQRRRQCRSRRARAQEGACGSVDGSGDVRRFAAGDLAPARRTWWGRRNARCRPPPRPRRTPPAPGRPACARAPGARPARPRRSPGPVAARTNSGVARRTAVGADDRGDLAGVDAVRARRHHEQWRAVGVEQQRVGDLPDLDAQRGGRGRGGRHGVGQHLQAGDPRGIGAAGGQIGDDELDVAVHAGTLPRRARPPRADSLRRCARLRHATLAACTTAELAVAKRGTHRATRNRGRLAVRKRRLAVRRGRGGLGDPRAGELRAVGGVEGAQDRRVLNDDVGEER